MAVTINFYNQFTEYMGDNSIDMDGDSFYHMLMNSSHTFTATHTQRTDVSANQIATANGYTQATGGGTGEQLASPTWTQPVAGTTMFDAADTSWSASGGSIAADDDVIFSDTSTNDLLMCSIDFDGTQTAGDGTSFLIAYNTNGIFRIA